MTNNLIPYEDLGLTKSRLEIIDKFVYYKKQVETFESELKEKFKDLVENEVIPVNSVDLGGVILSYKKAYTTKRIDTDKLKEDGLYDKYLKQSEVKSSVSMSVKKED